MSEQFITLTQLDGRLIALNVAHIIAFSPRPPQEYDEAGTEEGCFVHTTVGADRRGWAEWSVTATFDELRAMLAGIPA